VLHNLFSTTNFLNDVRYNKITINKYIDMYVKLFFIFTKYDNIHIYIDRTKLIRKNDQSWFLIF